MKGKIIKGISAVIFLLYFSAFFSQVQAVDDDTLIKELLDKSGATQQINMLPQVIIAMLPAQLAIHKGNEKISSIFNKKISSEFFAAKDIIDAVTEQLKKKFNRSHAKKYIKWLDSKLGKRITALEVEASSPDADRAIMAYSTQLRQQPPSENRIALIGKLVEVLKVAEHAEKETASIMIKISRGINKSLPQDRRTPDTVLEEIKKVYQKASTGQMETYVIPSFLYTYKSLSDKELKQYITFLNTEEGIWFNQIIFNAQLVAIEENCDKFGQALGNEIAKGPPPKKEKVKWREFSNFDSSFSIKLPGSVKTQKFEIPTEVGIIPMVTFTSQINDVTFLVSTVDEYPPLMQEEVDVQAILVNAAEGSAANTGGTIIESDYISLNEFPGIDFKVSILAGTGLIRSQIFLAKNSFYQLLITGTIRDVVSKEYARFFNSFKINKK